MPPPSLAASPLETQPAPVPTPSLAGSSLVDGLMPSAIAPVLPFLTHPTLSDPFTSASHDNEDPSNDPVAMLDRFAGIELDLSIFDRLDPFNLAAEPPVTPFELPRERPSWSDLPPSTTALPHPTLISADVTPPSDFFIPPTVPSSDPQHDAIRKVLGTINTNIPAATNSQPKSPTRLPTPPRSSVTEGFDSSKFPPWLETALAYLTKCDLGNTWEDVIHLFLRMEEKLGFPTSVSFLFSLIGHSNNELGTTINP